jgi:Outer membrane protein beta-barrel domain
VCLTTLAGLFSWLPTADAQTNRPAPRPVSFTVVAGLNVAKLSLPSLPVDDVLDDLDVNLTNTSRVGFAGGLLAALPVTPNFTFDFGAVLSQRGGGFTVTVPGVGAVEADLSVLYLDLPLHARLPVVRTRTSVLSVLAGGTVGARLRARSHASFEGQTFDESATSDLPALDFGLTVGGRVDAGRAVFIAQYLFGLTDTAKGDAPEPVRHRVFSVLAGWRF